ncbi:hypothetical protein [Microbulbifer variabilis]|uniref:hypothetical protein n=1 Tax=Microbulbifer variabilis TaxID=266805 RepID=UPI001CFEE53F|nr:hypothetical protein [Microbulbifer variabilis]
MSTEITAKKNTISTVMDISSVCFKVGQKESAKWSDSELYSSEVDFQKYIDIDKAEHQSGSDQLNWGGKLAIHIENIINDLNSKLEDVTNFSATTNLSFIIPNNFSLESKSIQSGFQHHLHSEYKTSGRIEDGSRHAIPPVNQPLANGLLTSQLSRLSEEIIGSDTTAPQLLNNGINATDVDKEFGCVEVLPEAQDNRKVVMLNGTNNVHSELGTLQKIVHPSVDRLSASQLSWKSQTVRPESLVAQALESEIDTAGVDIKIGRTETVPVARYDNELRTQSHANHHVRSVSVEKEESNNAQLEFTHIDNEVSGHGDRLLRTQSTTASLNLKLFSGVYGLHSDFGDSERIENGDIYAAQQVILPTTDRLIASQLSKLSGQKLNSNSSVLNSLNTEIDTVVADKEMVRAEILIRSLHDTRVSISLHEGALTIHFDSVAKGLDLADTPILSELRSMLEQKYSQLQVSVTTAGNVNSDFEEDISGSSRQNGENNPQGENSESRHQSDDGTDIEILLDDGLMT